ncbi:protein TPX2-like [Cucurbita pepo subsp. pepo]|uniref:protein TPX2-like n=1 Tax=Cucurbita pepo subsp. pepo TaxID=3664 RepID=UPI000C9D91D2|nr:protein TPX2-like [Cucurbita pepo subsp. pepo]
MAPVDDSNSDLSIMIDETYEFAAPRFFDFINGESEEDKCAAELWFDTALTYAPSPCMPKIKTARSIKVENLCDFNQAEEMQKDSELYSSNSVDTVEPTTSQTVIVQSETNKEFKPSEPSGEQASTPNEATEKDKVEIPRTCEDGRGNSSNGGIQRKDHEQKRSVLESQVQNDACTPLPTLSTHKGEQRTKGATSKRQETSRKIASMVKNPSALKARSQLQLSQTKNVKPISVKRETNMKKTSGTPSLAQENQAIKRQKLDGGLSRQILNVKPHTLLHKSKVGSSNLCSSVADKTNKEERKMYVREPAPFVSMAEMMRKFQSSTRDLSLPNVNKSHSQDAGNFTQSKSKLTLTRPKVPEFETAQRVRSTKVKSSAEIEEEMMAKMPKFKARPLNKKIMEAPKLPAVPRSTPQPPEFQEFHLETMARANQHADSASVISTESSRQNNQWKPFLTEPKTPVLHTSLRARPPRAKSFLEIEQEALEKIPKFKARPLDKKIFESKGELGMFCNMKKHVTKPQEFHFATNERNPPPPCVVADLFDKLSICSDTRSHNPLPRNTKPNPFHLYTEERGAEKERKFFMELVHKQLEEERAAIPRATPYPYTTDYPVIPPKPEPKQCTKPEPFQLESLVRHEEEMQKEMEERRRIEEEEARMRNFKALPVLKEDPIPLPEKSRKPLTEVQEFNLHVDNRAVDRAEFDQKIKEKEMMYKRYREESDAARVVEEEKALKQLRRTLVHHARPVPKFDHPFHPQRSVKETTKAKSPNLRVLQRRKERQNLMKVAMSSPAAQLR